MDYIQSIRSKVGNKKIILNAAGALIVKNGKVLLQHRSDNNKWGLIGGILELGETYEQAALREVKEETGLDVRLDAFLGIYHNYNMEWPNKDKAHVIGAYYLASIVSGTPRVDNESLELVFCDKDHLPELFAEDHRKVLEDYFNNRLDLNNKLNER